ncbi:hypothetical protein [Methylobacterium nodulans]|uniref:Uncharacterized protein n=1 Tax=Methylobacterium nodulans (strain LMG 21967 / CNCM I-2342 / ORS 2060) TaxID=460265 RepID=B8IG99_METNO|nr:hypothetical protein [Methylobacterium nodulans]ACL61576.1 hypothetical protein Mnod_6821 [Methylobacterium nodulans ORS 2060]
MLHQRIHESPQAPASCPVEDIVAAYLRLAEGDAALALRWAVTDALADLLAAERRTRERSRLISRGYASGRIGGA